MRSQKIKIVIKDLFSKSIKFWFSFDKSKYDEAIKKPITTGKILKDHQNLNYSVINFCSCSCYNFENGLK